MQEHGSFQGDNLFTTCVIFQLKLSMLTFPDIRHTQKQWKNFLLNALQGAKTVPTYLLSSHGGPWIAERIRQSMRLEVQHEKLPTAVWVAKVAAENNVIKTVRIYKYILQST